MSDQPDRTAGTSPLRRALVRLLFLAIAALGMWLLGSATAAADEAPETQRAGGLGGLGELVNGVVDDATQVVAPVLEAVVPSSPPVVAEPAPAPPPAAAVAPRPAPEPAPIPDPEPAPAAAGPAPAADPPPAAESSATPSAESTPGSDAATTPAAESPAADSALLGALEQILQPAEQILQPVQQILTSVDVVLVDTLSALEPVTAGLDQLVTELLDETVNGVLAPVLELGRDTVDDRRLGLAGVLLTSASSPTTARLAVPATTSAPAAAPSATSAGGTVDRPSDRPGDRPDRDSTDRTATSPTDAPPVATAPIAVAPISPDSDPDSAPALPAPATLPTSQAGHETAAAALDGAGSRTSDSGAVVDQLDIRTSSVTAHEPTSSPD